MKKSVSYLLFLLFATSIQAQNFTSEFEDSSSVANEGWVMDNNSSPLGSTGWFPGTISVFAAYSMNGYYAANYNNTSGTGTISNWLISPNRYLQNGDSIIFYTRTTDTSLVNTYPDRMQLRLSQNGTSVNAGTLATDVGDFTTLMLDINPLYDTVSYPSVWTKYAFVLSGLPGAGVSGRFAFRYFVEMGGPNGVNSDYIGIDSVAYTSITNGLTEISELQFSLFPNPCEGNVNIHIPNASSSDQIQVEVSDLSGRIVLSTYTQFEQSGNKELSLNGLAVGVYILSLNSSAGRTSKPLIIR